MSFRSADDDPLLGCLGLIARFYQRPISGDALKAGFPADGRPVDPPALIRMAAAAGFSAEVVSRSLDRFNPLLLPAILLLKDGACLLTAVDGDVNFELVFAESGGGRRLSRADLEPLYTGRTIFVQPIARLDQRAEVLAPLPKRSWFWGTLLKYRRQYLDVALASLFINLFAVASSLFVMNVYDRVVPNRALETLWVLAMGVSIVFLFDFLLRTLRGHFLDSAGKKADVLISAHLFRQVMAIRLEKRPASAGSMANTMKEFESLRDFFTSATLTTLIDLPFLFLFVAIIAYIGTWLALVPILAIPLVLAVGFGLQRPLERLTREHQAEASQKHGLLVEAISGLETLKSLGAEGVVQSKWEELVGLTAKTAQKSRLVSTFAVNFTMTVQQLVSVAIIVVGVYMIADGTLTMGALIACNILAGRALAPLGQLSGLLMRYQGARMAYQGLDKLMHEATDRDSDRTYLHRSDWEGAIQFAQVDFAYPGSRQPALQTVSFEIRAGERVAILGRAGSGKSTLAKLLDGLYRPTAGSILVDGVDIGQIDPTDLRRVLGYAGQDARLFYGSLRENIALGAAGADDDRIMAAARLVGIDEWIRRQANGLDRRVGENGEGLSGGQRQAVALGRVFLRDPRILMLDEPTAAYDHNAEQVFIAALQSYLEGRTLLLVTHKPALLTLVDRIIVLDDGKIVADGPKDRVLQALAQK